MHQLKQSARAILAAGITAAIVAVLPSHLTAQTPAKTKAQRDSATKADSMKHAGHNMPGMNMPATPPQVTQAPQIPDTMMMMTPEPLGISMERMGSGTTWIPDAVMLPSFHSKAGSWDLMLHGFVFGQYDKQGGPRGDEQF